MRGVFAAHHLHDQVDARIVENVIGTRREEMPLDRPRLFGVVDEDSRGRGVAEILCRDALNRACAVGARTVDLTSRPSRELANRLYRRLGFVQRDTNVYRWSG